MYDLAKLCENIHLPEEVTAFVLSDSQKNDGGLATLWAHLQAACRAWDRYEELEISEEVYIATMAAFSRFVREHMASFGVYGFDRDFWTTRQTGCVLFRIGELEYELRNPEGERFVSLHIPSDADLSLPSLGTSLEEARKLLERAFPDYAGAPMTCHSWLLSPQLAELLPEKSRILGFQRGFAITEAEDDGEFRQWAYGREDIPDAQLPENTTLQRKLKAFLLAGNTFHSGRGTLKKDAFLLR